MSTNDYTEWTKEQREAIKRLSDGSMDARDVTNAGSVEEAVGVTEGPRPGTPANHGKVTKALCESMREAHADGMTSKEIGDEFGISESSVRYHLRDECEHEAGYVDERRCNLIRDLRSDGHSAPEIAEAYTDVSVRGVQRHAVGDCECDSETPPVSKGEYRKVDDATCRWLRIKRRETGRSFSVLAERVGGISKWTSRDHVRGNCTCDVSVAPVED